ncbi:hypothetical protein HPB50_016816 [Hyalomma asiaticum]|uniref:Uncharacterized protein n=1 Tax=Hyalomma asiaticum TaxID=266040 RepID=A0ACB7RZX7_HYAAI|nr:hypothetical protein HPB50_016816 [Hyalomma asiaticum]
MVMADVGRSRHRDWRSHYMKRTFVLGQRPHRKRRRDRAVTMEQDKEGIHRTFLHFFILSLVALYVYVVLYLHFAKGPEQGKDATAKVTGELVLCVASCHGASRDVALVRRGRPGSTDAKDVQAASYALPRPCSYPREQRGWPLRPFAGPFVALVSSRPQNKGRRKFIRNSWAKPSLYPAGAFRLIFFVREPRPGANDSERLRKLLKHESDKHEDMLVDGFALSTTRAAMLEWAPAFANASHLLLWARDSAAFDATTLLARMEHLAGIPGDVFGRESALGNRDAAVNEGTKYADSPWDRLEQCAYFIRMAALLRLSSVYEDVPRRASTKDEFELVTPPLATRANLTMVYIDVLIILAPNEAAASLGSGVGGAGGISMGKK